VPSCADDEAHRQYINYQPQNGAPISLHISPQHETNDFCDGETVTLTAGGSRDGVYRWTYEDLDPTTNDYNPNNIIESRSTCLATRAGIYHVAADNICGIPQTNSVSLSFKANLSQLSINGGQSTVCKLTTIDPMSFTVQGQGIEFIYWDVTGDENGNSINFSGNPGTVQWGTDFFGVATITATVHGCHDQTQTVTKQVEISSLPEVSVTPAGPNIIPFRQSYFELTALTDPGNHFQWLLDGSGLPDATGATYQANELGHYTVTVTKPNGCSKTSGEVYVGYENNYNYIIENNLQSDAIDSNGTPLKERDIPTADITKNRWQIQYLDGIGRPMQTIVTQGTPQEQDMVTPIVYDDLGREATKYLPYASVKTNGWYNTDALLGPEYTYDDSPQKAFYNQATDKVAQDQKPFAETVFEPSPLNRVIEQGAPGTSWQLDTHKTITKSYEYNGPAEVLSFTYSSSDNTLAIGSSLSYYDANELFANKTQDEERHEVIEYTDGKGRTVCKKVQYKTEGNTKLYASTYYIYDEKDHLVMVLPPEAIVEILKQH
jgi:hypothetical protein